MALSTYSELQAAISAWLDGSVVSGRETDFIALCEDEINAKLAAGVEAGRVIRPMMTRGALSIDDEYVDLPDSNMVVPLSLEVTDYDTAWQVDYLSADHLALLSTQIGDAYDTSLPPMNYTVIGDELRFFPPPSATWAAQLIRFDKLPSLSETVTTNWLLASHKNVYLYGTLAQAELLGWNDDGVQKFAALFENACEGLLRRYPEQSSQAKLRTEAAMLGNGRGLSLNSFMAGNF
jgi:hypothetical protein